MGDKSKIDIRREETRKLFERPKAVRAVTPCHRCPSPAAWQVGDRLYCAKCVEGVKL